MAFDDDARFCVVCGAALPPAPPSPPPPVQEERPAPRPVADLPIRPARRKEPKATKAPEPPKATKPPKEPRARKTPRTGAPRQQVPVWVIIGAMWAAVALLGVLLLTR